MDFVKSLFFLNFNFLEGSSSSVESHDVSGLEDVRGVLNADHARQTVFACHDRSC